MKRFLEKLRDLGYERVRVAVALLPLSLFSFVYLLGTLNAPPEWKGALGGLMVCYLTFTAARPVLTDDPGAPPKG